MLISFPISFLTNVLLTLVPIVPVHVKEPPSFPVFNLCDRADLKEIKLNQQTLLKLRKNVHKMSDLFLVIMQCCILLGYIY